MFIMVQCPRARLHNPVGAMVFPLLPERGQEMGPFFGFVRHRCWLESGSIQGINIYIHPRRRDTAASSSRPMGNNGAVYIKTQRGGGGDRRRWRRGGGIRKKGVIDGGEEKKTVEGGGRRKMFSGRNNWRNKLFFYRTQPSL